MGKRSKRDLEEAKTVAREQCLDYKFLAKHDLPVVTKRFGARNGTLWFLHLAVPGSCSAGVGSKGKLVSFGELTGKNFGLCCCSMTFVSSTIFLRPF